MSTFLKNGRSVSAILWLITGVLFTGVLIQSLSIKQEFAVYAEEKALEFDSEEDDRDGAKSVVFVMIVSSGFSLPQNCQTSVSGGCIQTCQDFWRSYSGRAPPGC
jgi:hypothetical protein